ncbi:neuronal acetylcholine receptor subunit alpha-9-like [Cotesia glomerata]|uniref:neuronal acetylcholine receptor subunit alpha-9-like n=1 Tax=Cotesia glomerata TaxID=32391 RepID=UPI001D0228ED|nr:neuronal acetylcholine receptor subunit alpha-9-like [Cotesia glomerata]
MYKILILILSVVIENAKCFESTCKDIESKSVDLRLRRHLFCDYDPTLRPQISAHSVLNIDVNLIPKFIEFDDVTSSINFHSWLMLTWDDVHLNWNPDEFDGITLHHVKSTDIWVPDFTVFNSGDLGLDQSSMPLTDCILSQNGTIQCVVSRVFTSHCPADFSDWPYDNHNCTLHFGSWLYFTDELNYYFTKDSIVMDEFVRNNEWEVKLGNISKSLELYGSNVDSMIFLNIEIQRNSSRGILIYITPAIILTILTLTALYLDVCSIERTILMSTNFISHLFCIFDLHWYIPTNNAIGSPKIVIFYEASLIITAFTFILTILLRKIYTVTIPAPQLIFCTVEFIYNCPIVKYLKAKTPDKSEENNLNDTDNQNEQMKNKNTLWMECVNLIEWLALVSVIITYGILFIVLTPASPRNQIEHYIF